MPNKAFVYGDSVDTDVILPARYLALYKPEDLAKHCMEDLDETFAGTVRPGDLVVAGENFGCGSSREHAPLALKACGVSLVIARSFARIFYRNALNIGLPILENKQVAASISHGDDVECDLECGEVRNLTTGQTYRFEAFPPFIQDMIDQGGLLASIQKRMAAENQEEGRGA